jgi:hypothetical protein
VPKCGGTSLSQAFRIKYAASYFRMNEEICSHVVPAADGDRWMEYKRNLFLYQALAGKIFVQGHVAYSEESFAQLRDRAIFMSLLREPTDRVISHYFFDPRTACMPFDEFLDSQRGRIECSVYSRFFGGLSLAAPEPTEAHRDAAIETLKSFDIVGIVEDPAALEADLRTKARMNLRLPRRNVGKQRQANGDHVIEPHLPRLREMCRFDIEIYNALKGCNAQS